MRSGWIILPALLCALAAPAQAPAEGPSDDVFRTTMWRDMLAADQLAAKGDWEAASAGLLKLSAEAPGNLLLLEKSALALERAGRWADAREQWTAFSGRSPNRPDALIRLGRCHLMLERTEDASKVLEIAAALNPDALESRLLLAAIRIRKDPTNDVARIFRVLTVGQAGTLLYGLAGDEPLRKGFLTPGGVQGLARWILGGGSAPADANAPGAEPTEHALRTAAAELARLEQALQIKNHDRSRAALGQAVARGARGAFIDAYGAYLDMDEGRAEAARKAMDELVRIHPGEHKLRHFYGVMLLEHGEFADAAGHLRVAADLSGRRPEVLFSHACALSGAGRNQEALLQLKSMARRNREQALALLNNHAPALDSLRKTPEYDRWYESLVRPGDQEP